MLEWLGARPRPVISVDLAADTATVFSDNGPLFAAANTEAFWTAETARLLAEFEKIESTDPVCDSEEGECDVADLLPISPEDMAEFDSGADPFSLKMASASSALLAPRPAQGIDLNFVLPEDNPTRKDLLVVSPTELQTAGLAGFSDSSEVAWQVRKVGSYQIRLSLKRGWLPSCIKRELWYIGVDIQKIVNGRGTRLFNLHFGGWWTWRGPCFAVWESIRTGYCRVSCTWNLWSFVAGVTAGILAYQLSGWIVGAISNAVAGATVSGLTLAPGVPPPP